MNQKILRLSLPRNLSEPAYAHRLNEHFLNFPPQKIPKAKLLADLLRRQSRKIMADITECPPLTLPAHLARLDGLIELFRHLLRHDYEETSEAVLSGVQLLYPATLADFLAAMEITRKQHRAPAFTNSRDTDVADCKRMFGIIAGLLSTHPLSEEIIELSGTESGVAL